MTEIKLQTQKADLKFLIENNETLRNSLFIKYLDQEALYFFYTILTPKTLNQGELLLPQNEAGNFFMVISGEILTVFKKGTNQKLIGTLSKGDVFAMRKDFENTLFYANEKSLLAVIDKDNLKLCFEKAPQTKNLLRNYLIDISNKIEQLNKIF